MSILSCKKLSISIANKQVCNELDLNIEAGQIWGILGRNGVGKTTLLHTLAGLRQADSGSISIEQSPMVNLSRKQIAQKLGLLLQQTEESFPSTVIETVLCGRHPHINNWQWESKDDLEIAVQALEVVQMSDMANCSIDHLSGGERQRVAIASLLTQSPDIYLLDEPNSHLDLNYQINLLKYFVDLCQSNDCTTVMTLHDINLASRFCTHLLFLYGDSELEYGPTETLLDTGKLQRLFGHPINSIQSGEHTLFWPA